MKFSVVTATWNCAESVGKTVRSVMAQGIPAEDLEHLIVDNDSTDGTLEAVAACGSPCVRVLGGRDTGIYNAFNKGLAAARGDVVAFLNSGDSYLDGALAAAAAAFASSPEAVCVHGNIRVCGRSLRPRGGLLSFGGARIYHPACVMRRDAVLEAGGFDESFKIMADLDLFLRMKSRHQFHYLDRALTDFALGGVSTRNVFRNCVEMRLVLRKNGYGPASAWFLFALETFRSALGALRRRVRGAGAVHDVRRPAAARPRF